MIIESRMTLSNLFFSLGIMDHVRSLVVLDTKNKEETKKLKCPGVYFVFYSDELIYIGESIYIQNRLRQHKFVKEKIVALEIHNTRKRKEIEALLINLLAPSRNITYNWSCIISNTRIINSRVTR